MAGELTNYGSNRAVAAGLGEAVDVADGQYLALATGLPALPDTATLAAYVAKELTTAGYARVAVSWGAASGGGIANDAAVAFGPFTADPPEATHAFLTDAASGTTGNVMAYWAITAPAPDADTGQSISFAIGNLTMTVD
jgi:hypothetical protein